MSRQRIFFIGDEVEYRSIRSSMWRGTVMGILNPGTSGATYAIALTPVPPNTEKYRGHYCDEPESGTMMTPEGNGQWSSSGHIKLLNPSENRPHLSSYSNRYEVEEEETYRDEDLSVEDCNCDSCRRARGED